MKYVVFYESADDVASKAPAHFPAHRVRIDDFHRRGDLLMIGIFGDPQQEGSMAVFAIWLRQRGSPESKPVGAPHSATGLEG